MGVHVEAEAQGHVARVINIAEAGVSECGPGAEATRPLGLGAGVNLEHSNQNPLSKSSSHLEQLGPETRHRGLGAPDHVFAPQARALAEF